MAAIHRPSIVEQDVDQAITALKKGACLLKYRRRRKPKFCPFRLSADETKLVWYNGKYEKQLELRHVSKIIPGQRTPTFQRYPRPEKEYQSFSLLHNDRSLDLICKDKDEGEVWFASLKALIVRNKKKLRNEPKTEVAGSDSPHYRRTNQSSSFGDTLRNESRWGKVFSDIVSYSASTTKTPQIVESRTYSTTSLPSGPERKPLMNTNTQTSGAEMLRVSLSSAVSSSSQGSCNEDFDSIGDVFIWGEGVGEGVMGGGIAKVHRSFNPRIDALLPKALESTTVLDVQNIACGQNHAVLVTKLGEIFSWGEGTGGRLGHGLEADVPQPKLIEALRGKNIHAVACGTYHSCAVTLSGDIYTWGDRSLDGSEASHWIPKRVSRPIDGLQVSFVSCGPWHTSFLTFSLQLFTFGDGAFGALGHGDRQSTSTPREVESLRGLRTLRVACGVWHTVAIVELTSGALNGKLFTWGDGDKNRLGHGDNESKLVPECIASLIDVNFSRVACGDNITVALTTSGRVYTMGSTSHGKLGSPLADGKNPFCIGGYCSDGFVENVACGSHHVVILSSKGEVYTWGKGKNGQLGHGDNDDRNMPTLVAFLKDKQVKSIACGSNFTAVICLHKWISSTDNSFCTACRNPFTFRWKRHNCYNCGLVFCKMCSSSKSQKASLAPDPSKPFRVCDDCFLKLQKAVEFSFVHCLPKVKIESSCKPSDITRQIAKPSSVDSFKSERSSTENRRSESNDTRLFALQNGDNQRGSTASKSSTSPSIASKSFLSLSVPNSGIVSRSPSPAPGKSSHLGPATHSPTLSLQISEAAQHDLKSKYDSPRLEIKSLRAQVEELASKSKLLEAELEMKSKQVKEASEKAAAEAGKSKAAKQVIKSLKTQMKEIAARVLTEQDLATNKQIVRIDTKRPSKGSSIVTSSFNPTLSDITKRQVHKTERTIQEEAGVYITLISLPNGVNELRRIRFSRKRFTEEQAEKWWSENGTRVCQRHKIQTAE